MDVELNKVRVRREEVVQLDPELDMPAIEESLPTSESMDSLSEGQSSSVYVHGLMQKVLRRVEGHEKGAIAGETGRAQNTAAIVGGVVGGVLIIAIAVSLTVWLVLRRKRQERLRSETEATGNGIEDPRDREMQQQAFPPGAHLNEGFEARPSAYAQRPSRWNEAPPNQIHEAPFVAPIGSRHNAAELT
ncbi:hypothetical protein C8035_v003102 [Colletotrichum spinosum]|uniref:Uncharacterized protein n=1 Tax=Colletotrichum spinosum TaxID=1347390 RepID=A0A4R8Q0E6_9PEZI|nr:hypothetical protein C8035_v003102 [Colletotrichum spinosum]